MLSQENLPGGIVERERERGARIIANNSEREVSGRGLGVFHTPRAKQDILTGG